MTAALYDEVVTVAPARKLTVVRDVTPTQAPAPKKVTRRRDTPDFRPRRRPAGGRRRSLVGRSGASRVRGAVACRGARSPGRESMDSERPAPRGYPTAGESCGQVAPWSRRGFAVLSRIDVNGIDPAITGEPSEEQPLRPSRTERVGPSQPAMSGRA